MDNEIIKKNFYEARRIKGLSWATLTQKAGIQDYHKITNILNSPGLSLASLERLAKLVECEPWELLKPIEPTPQEQPEPTTQTAICPHCGKPIQLCKPEPTQEIEQ